MKLKEYLEELNSLVEESPESLEYEVIYSSDDEGNYYSDIHFSPSIGYYESESFCGLETLIEEGDARKLNAVCVN